VLGLNYGEPGPRSYSGSASPKGPSIKYIALFWTNFDPSLSHFVTHLGTPPGICHASRNPPIFSRTKNRKTSLYKISLNFENQCQSMHFCMYTYICVYLTMYAYMYVIYVCLYTYIHACNFHAYIQLHAYRHSYIYTCTRTCIHTWMHAYIHAYIYIYTYYTQMYTCIHMHTHMHTYMSLQGVCLSSGVCPEVFLSGRFCSGCFLSIPLLSTYIRFNKKLNITFNFRFHMYDTKFKSVTSHALDTSLCHKLSQLLGRLPLKRDVVYGRSPSLNEGRGQH